MSFSQYPAMVVWKAVQLHIEKNKFFPTVAEVNENIQRAQLILQEPIQPPTKQITANRTYSDDELTALLDEMTGNNNNENNDGG